MTESKMTYTTTVEIANLNQERKGLMQKLLTGEVRVNI